MSESIPQTYTQKEFNNLIALFAVYQKDIEKIKKAREFLNTPFRSINRLNSCGFG